MSNLLSKRVKSRPIIDLAAPVENEVCGYHLMPVELDELVLLEAENAALKEENQRLQQELYDMENDEAWRLESLASDERIRDE